MTNNDANGAGARVIKDPQPQHAHDTIFDLTSETFKAPKEVAKRKKGYWKRRFLICLIVFLMVACGVGILYWLVKVNHVNVRVLADNRRNSSNAKTDPNSEQRESGLSAEAINIARAAVGNDPAPAQVGPSANASPSTPANTSGLSQTTDLSLGPASDPRVADAEAAALSLTNVPPNPTGEDKPTAEAPLQSRANTAQTIFVADDPISPPARAAVSEATPVATRAEIQNKAIERQKKSAVLPPFGTMLPVRTQSVLLSIRNNSYARLELTREVSGEGWSMPKGTVVIGRMSGSELDRAFVNIMGYIEPKENRFVIMKGEVLGSDGGTGLPGKGGKMTADRNRFKQTLAKIGASGLQAAGTLAGALTGRLPVFMNNSGDEVFGPRLDRASLSTSGNARSFVKVKAGEPGYVMVTDLPKEIDSIDALGTEELKRAATSLTDVEVMELVLFGTPEEFQSALPLMNAQQRAMVGRLGKSDGKP